MTFIGVATAGKDEDYIINNLEKNLKDKSVKVISINKNSIDNLKNVKFETILVDDVFIVENKNLSLEKEKKLLKHIVKNSKNVILNSDILENFDLVKDTNLSVITYGFNPKATITMSSLENDSMLVCLQRNVKLIDGTVIEQQEMKLNGKLGKINNTKRLGMMVTELFYGKKLK